MASMNRCETCDYKPHGDGGHCYMFKEEPKFLCQKHTLHRKTKFPADWVKATQALLLVPSNQQESESEQTN